MFLLIKKAELLINAGISLDIFRSKDTTLMKELGSEVLILIKEAFAKEEKEMIFNSISEVNIEDLNENDDGFYGKGKRL
ncbi:hypothetical protein CG435_12980 [Pantoea ananatis]|uniref:hypothetical protein n=1 Tax=Pantoea ananas TaxID=553 RepID=UPI000D4C7CCC|nr:hypothetical protein [Pantoea ananatis]PQK99982.1 hypothetical protein CG435_12980 [Pantoea ananatis]